MSAQQAGGAPPEDGARVWVPARRGLTAGLLLTITTIAFEQLGVSTAMPVVADDLDGVDLYGWTFTAALLGSLIGIALGGARVDRDGPARPFLAGLVLFATGLVGAATAQSMEVLVASRLVQGLGVGVVPSVVYASIGRAFGERARARMFALLSTAWVVPGLVGPAVSGWVAETVGWRWVFLGVLPMIPLNALLTAPSLARLGRPDAAEPAHGDRRTVLLAVALAGSTALLVGGLNTATAVALVLAAVGGTAAWFALRELLPAGTLTAQRGLPAAIATRGVATAAFFTAQAFLPLTLTELRGQRPAFAGLALTLSTLTWTGGAWLQDRRGHITGRKPLVVRGLGILFAGVAATSLVIAEAVPVAVAVVTWAVAGLGMGMVYGGLSLIVLAEAAPGQEGRASSSLQLAEQVSIASGAGFAGAAVAASDRAGVLVPGLVVAFALASLAALAGNASARRMHDSVSVDRARAGARSSPAR